MSRNALLAQIHIAKKELSLDDETYRDVLQRVTGQRSSAQLNDNQRGKVVAELKRLGFRPKSTHAAKGRRISDKPYVRKVFALWGELKRKGVWRDPSPHSLRRFVKKMTATEGDDGCDDLEWLTWPQANIVIEALKKMKERGDKS